MHGCRICDSRVAYVDNGTIVEMDFRAIESFFLSAFNVTISVGNPQLLSTEANPKREFWLIRFLSL